MKVITTTNVRLAALLSFALIMAFVGGAHAAIPTKGIFIPNLGQWDEQARFHMTLGVTESDPRSRLEVWLTDTGYVYHVTDLSPLSGRAADETAPVDGIETSQPLTPAAVHQHSVAVSFVGAQPPAIESREAASGTFNWLVGENASSHVKGVQAQKKVFYRSIYPGVDAYFEPLPESAMLETTYEVAPGARPDAIVIQYDGADSLSLSESGNLLIGTSLGQISELKPFAFQKNESGDRQEVGVSFALDDNRVAFRLGDYDETRTLYIDPVVNFSRTFGGSSTDYVSEMHEDGTGRYLTGYTLSSNFPVTAGAYDTTYDSQEIFAVKFDLANENLLWATYIGSTGNEYGGNSALAADGSLYLVASTASSGTWPKNHSYGVLGGSYDVGVFHLSADGSSMVSGATLGGSGTDHAADIELDGGGNVVISGATQSANFPTQPGYDTTFDTGTEAFVLRLGGDLNTYTDFTYVGGGSSSEAASGHAFDAAGNVYVYGVTTSTTGYPSTTTIGPGGNYDLILAKFDAGLDNQAYNARIGGTSTDPHPGWSYISANYYNISNSGIIVDNGNRAWVTGASASEDFPTTPGVYQATNAGNYDVFVLAMNPAGTALDYSTFVGGSSTDIGRAIGFDAAGRVLVAGSAASANYPTTPSTAPQPVHGGNYDFVFTVLTPDLSDVLCSTYWGGGSGDYASDLEIDSQASYQARIAGFSSGSDYPQVPVGSPVFGPGGGYDGAVASLGCQALPPAAAIPAVPLLGLAFLALMLPGLALYWRRKR